MTYRAGHKDDRMETDRHSAKGWNQSAVLLPARRVEQSLDCISAGSSHRQEDLAEFAVPFGSHDSRGARDALSMTSFRAETAYQLLRRRADLTKTSRGVENPRTQQISAHDGM